MISFLIIDSEQICTVILTAQQNLYFYTVYFVIDKSENRLFLETTWNTDEIWNSFFLLIYGHDRFLVKMLYT